MCSLLAIHITIRVICKDMMSDCSPVIYFLPTKKNLYIMSVNHGGSEKIQLY